ncbi:gamma-glutamyltransferase family protein [Methylophaga sp.]|uniref:gamma-glutamyltransferase family protein n=1 Tax=Methylophaga sp. TaxID=2024840 RepID=UPI00271F465C|nr:gamma-glutamyltransferase [Methylophaga sp.]MDO8826880.1 gamma-glutamyltransferase [Methylophaga sp.]
MTTYGFSAPHHLASATGNKVLENGGSAIDAMIAAAATIAVVYPHMNSLGGDGFWLIQRKGEAPIAIDGCGRSANAITANSYRDGIPTRGEHACVSQAGTISGWQLARDYLAKTRQPLPLSDLFKDAIFYCEDGIEVTQSFINACNKILKEDCVSDAFKAIYTAEGQTPELGSLIRNPNLSQLLKSLAENGLDDFYRGETAKTIADFFEQSASPLSHADFIHHTATYVEPLQVYTSQAKLYNLPAPTQGIASLLILAIYDRLFDASWDEAEQIHHLVEATKQAFLIRDQYVTDPDKLTEALSDFLTEASLDKLSGEVLKDKALPWPKQALPGDTVWMGAVDAEGTVVSFIQSVYWEFGSGVVIPELGLVWNNRGVSFSLDEKHINFLEPNKKPMHTLNPALAVFNNGDRMAYGTMGGEGQPQTQAALFNYYHYQGKSLSEAISSPRWLLGRTWGDASQSLKMERQLFNNVAGSLMALGHDIEQVDDCNEMMGHAGAVVLTANNEVMTAVDPRSDGLKETND